MKKFIVVFLALVVMMSSSQVYGQPVGYGFGNKTCGQYVKSLDGQRRGNQADTIDHIIFVSWSQGFMSCQSLEYSKDMLYGRDMDSVILWLENCCREHPLELFSGATLDLIIALQKKEQKSLTPRSPPP